MTNKPASVFKMKNAGTLEVGKPADIAIFDLKDEHEIKESEYLSKGRIHHSQAKPYMATL